ncbi:hypothetical protein ONA92_26185 [Mycobacteroides salmoniphilum]|uniref:hypothetical protein n=1 Tax=Mycobacteroides salmoniphilum TaxID=404941 RepID=UPI0035660DBA
MLISAMQFGGTEESAAQIGRWLKRETKVVHGVLFTVGRGGALHHGPKSCWVTKHRDGSIGTKLNEVITEYYEPAPPAHDEARHLAAAVITEWKAKHSGGEAFAIGDENELLACLTHAFEANRKLG